MNEKKKAAYKPGVIVLIGLAVLTGIEYAVALIPDTTIFLFLIALMKAWAILQYFMHVKALWSEEEHA